MLDMIDREIKDKSVQGKRTDLPLFDLTRNQGNFVNNVHEVNSNADNSSAEVERPAGNTESAGLRRLRKVLNDDTKFEEYIVFSTWGGDRRSKEFNSFQVANQQLEKVGQGKVTYILKRLERDYPDILAAYQRGDVVSANLLSHYRPPDPSTPMALANALVASHKA